MTDQPAVLVSTRSTLPAQSTQRDDQFRLARAIADAGAMIPAGYRGKPGAVILVQEWANRRGIDVMTAMQTVSFIDGKPVIDATMQRALAQRDGYEVRVVEADDTVATVEVWREDRKLGSASYTIEQAKRANLTSKKNWQQNPEDMLVARATTRAMRRCAPDVLIGVFDQDEAEMGDPVAVAAAPQTEVESAPDPTPDIVDAEVIDPSPAPSDEGADDEMTDGDSADGTAMTVETLKVRIKSQGVTQSELITEAKKIASHHDLADPSSLPTIVADPKLLELCVSWLDSLDRAES